ncbi:hypothetical protein ACFOGI_02465 [Virgibacillus xinjiangensis]|uniref:Uncharacterized protein n=1 Tax=Virgibacillus xinjiangensis TaxID=393090 RepID=A0ABV7CS64_9BACI
MRTIIVILLLAVFFMGGMVYGMDRSGYPKHIYGEVASTVVEKETIEKEEVPVEAPKRNTMDLEEPEHFTHKAATILDVVVRGFYEALVAILYGISELFV